LSVMRNRRTLFTAFKTFISFANMVHVIKDENRKQVALTRYGVGHSCILNTTDATDPILMILLAAIATQADNRV
jgi:hypothetical protein